MRTNCHPYLQPLFHPHAGVLLLLLLLLLDRDKALALA
jgi:hypothetical protein